MKIVRKRASSRNSLRASQPDLFTWRPAPVLNAAPVAARKLAQRYGITIPHAEMGERQFVALLATTGENVGIFPTPADAAQAIDAERKAQGGVA